MSRPQGLFSSTQALMKPSRNCLIPMTIQNNLLVARLIQVTSPSTNWAMSISPGHLTLVCFFSRLTAS